MSNFLTKGFKAMRAMLHGGVSWGGFGIGGFGAGNGRVNYRRKVGSLLDASVVMAPVQWVQRALPEAKLVVRRTKRDGEVEVVKDHPMIALIRKPNDFYADIVLWWGITLSLLLDGNAYVMIIRNGYGQPAELWYIPHWMMEPKREQGSKAFIDHYRYSPGSGIAPVEVDPVDVIHVRHGINPRNAMKGIAPLDSALREIFMDNESSAFVSALLANMGVPGVVISPKGGTVAPGDAEATKAWFQESFGGDNRGKPLVMGAETVVSQYGFNPQQMNMSEARDVAEERVCALVGIPAAVVGFGAGLQSTKVGATMKEMREQAWQNGVLPYALLIADEFGRSLLPFYKGNEDDEVDWDTDNVKALQEDEDKRTDRWGKRLATGAITIFEYRVALGMEADDSHKVYLRPMAVMEIPEGETQASLEEAKPPPPAVVPPPAANPPLPAPAEPAKGLKHGDHDHEGRDHPKATASAYKRGAAYVRMLQRQESGLLKAVETPLKKLFTDLGAATAKASDGELKNAKEDDDALVDRILAKLGIDKWQNRLKAVYIAHYEAAAKAANEAANSAGISGPMPDEVARSVIGAGGRRAAMVDLDKQTRQAIFDALAEGREAGEGTEALAKRIVGYVEAGPWGSAETRARVIARTETKYAQNVSTIERAKAGGVEQFIVFDGRLGPGRSKPDHIARDGSIVTAAEADRMAEAEHPNGTLSFAPHFG